MATNVLKVFEFATDKDQWDTIPAVIYSSIRTLHQNCSNIKRFVEKLETQIKTLTKRNSDLERKVATLEDRCNQHDRRGAFLFLYSSNLFARQRDVHMKLENEVNHIQAVQECYTREWVKETNGTSADFERLSTELILEVSSERHKSHEAKNNYIQELDRRLESCRSLAEDNQNRLMASRQSLLTVTYMAEELGKQVVETQYKMKWLEDSRIEIGPIERKFNEVNVMHLDAMKSVEASVVSMQGDLDRYGVELRQKIDQVLDDTDAQLVTNGEKLLSTLHDRLDPMAQYLNQLHYKQDAGNEMLNIMETKTLPNLESKINSLSTSADRQQVVSTDAFSKLNMSKQEMQSQIENLVAECGRLQTELKLETRNLRDNVIALQNNELRGYLDQATARISQLEGDHGALQEVTRNLEQKVAKWISTRPLPAKLSEARLYSLETTLQHVMTQFLQWENHMGQPPQEVSTRVAPEDEYALVPLPPVDQSSSGRPAGHKPDDGAPMAICGGEGDNSLAACVNLSEHRRSKSPCISARGKNPVPCGDAQKLPLLEMVSARLAEAPPRGSARDVVKPQGDAPKFFQCRGLMRGRSKDTPS